MNSDAELWRDEHGEEEEMVSREYGRCQDCVFYDGGDGGYGEQCNVGNETFEERANVYNASRITPCYDRRDIHDMRIMLDKENGK